MQTTRLPVNRGGGVSIPIRTISGGGGGGRPIRGLGGGGGGGGGGSGIPCCCCCCRCCTCLNFSFLKTTIGMIKLLQVVSSIKWSVTFYNIILQLKYFLYPKNVQYFVYIENAEALSS